jgi:hypothetical protein
MDPDSAQKGIDNLRATARWLLQVYAAIGALLLAGTPFTGIGLLNWGDRLLVAVVCGLVALILVALIVLLASRVLATEATTIADVRSLPAGSQEARLIARGEILPAGATLATLRTTDAHARPVLMLVAFDRYRRRFVDLQWSAAIGSVVAALAITGFVWAANGPKQQAFVYSLPDRGTAILTEPARLQLAPKLGAECVSRPVPILILDDKSGFDVVSLPQGGCAVVRFTVKDATTGIVSLVDE